MRTKSIFKPKLYNVAKKEAKKAIQEEKFKSYYELYSKLGTKDGEKKKKNLLRQTEMKTNLS